MSVRKKIDHLLKKLEKSYATHNRIEVSARALKHNLAFFQRHTGLQVIPVLKSNAYGHGIELVAEALKKETIPYIAVDGYFEACRIREVSRQPVLIMGAIKPENFTQLRYDKFAFVVHDETTINALGRTGKHINVHLECNTGMNRYGAEPEEIAKLAQCIAQHKNLRLEGVMSHLADGDGDDPHTVIAAVTRFDQCVETIHNLGIHPPLIHIAQTAGSIKAQSRYATAIRIGIGLYGINPFTSDHPLHSTLGGLQPALRLISTITQTHQLEAGEGVSYNYTFIAPKSMKIGVLPLGYYEGVHRSLSNKGFVQIGHHYAPIVGKICMNHTIINLDGIDANVGDEVIVYSNQSADRNSIDHTAEANQLFNYNLLTALTADIRRSLTE